MPVKSGYLMLTGGGAILVWSGLKGKSWSQVARNLVTGNSLANVPDINTIQAGDIIDANSTLSSNTGSTPATDSAIANDGLTYVGVLHYIFGGPNAAHPGTVDCSSFVNLVAGRDLGLSIPMYKNGSYPFKTHGPNTLIWLAWPGCKTIKRSEARAGDLAIWQTHMGIITDNGKNMVSALNPKLGVMQTPITGPGGAAPPGEILVVRRIREAL